jgi:hypothetical protein
MPDLWILGSTSELVNLTILAHKNLSKRLFKSKKIRGEKNVP